MRWLLHLVLGWKRLGERVNEHHNAGDGNPQQCKAAQELNLLIILTPHFRSQTSLCYLQKLKLLVVPSSPPSLSNNTPIYTKRENRWSKTPKFWAEQEWMGRQTPSISHPKFPAKPRNANKIPYTMWSTNVEEPNRNVSYRKLSLPSV